MDGRRRILEATLARLTTDGFAGMTVEQIAADAGVAKTTIYRWWPDRRGLVLDALQLVPPLDDPDTGSVVDDMCQIYLQTMRLVEKHNLGAVLPAMASELRRSSEMAGQIEAYMADRASQVGDAVRRGVENGQLPPGTDVDLAVLMLSSPFGYSIFFSRQGLDEASYRRCVETVIAGMWSVFREEA